MALTVTGACVGLAVSDPVLPTATVQKAPMVPDRAVRAVPTSGRIGARAAPSALPATDSGAGELGWASSATPRSDLPEYPVVGGGDR